jgi:predicted aldo/keto reductase-like oxidoreductase
MGVFIISPTDKGGKLHCPSPQLRTACEPLSAMCFHDLWLLSRVSGVSVLSIGPAEPGNFDEHMKALSLLGTERGEQQLNQIDARLQEMKVQALGQDYCSHWAEALPYWSDTPGMVNVRVILWLRTLVLSFGMLEYAQDRYGGLATSGGQSSWYPGGRAERALELRSEISAACQDNRWAAEIPGYLAEMHALLGGERSSTVAAAATTLSAGSANAAKGLGEASGKSEGEASLLAGKDHLG